MRRLLPPGLGVPLCRAAMSAMCTALEAEHVPRLQRGERRGGKTGTQTPRKKVPPTLTRTGGGFETDPGPASAETPAAGGEVPREETMTSGVH